MKIAVDGFEITPDIKGPGRVIDNLLSRLIGILPEHEFLVMTREYCEKYSEARARQYVLPAKSGYFRWQNGPLRRKLNKLKPDLFIASNYTLPLWYDSKSILIVHDISVITHPEWYPKKVAIGRKFLLRRSLKRAGLVVVPSEFTKSEIVSKLAFPPEKIRVVSLGVDERLRRSSDAEIRKWRESRGLKDRRVIGFLGSIFRRRNLPALVEAVDKLRTEFPGTILHIIGRDMTYPPQRIGCLLLQDCIRWEKSLEEQEIPLFYSALDAFAYLSDYEGFGLPPLEALACGTVPVVTATSSLKEVFQGMAIMVESADPDEVKLALKNALTDRNLKEACLGEFARRREHFSWERAAGELASLIRDNA